MFFGFVSGGTIDDEVERDDAWRAAQKEIEEKRRLKYEEEEKHGASGQSLFEVLQANKAAKQEAFEEAARFKNQYRGLDDSEAEYLESLVEAKKKEEATISKDTLEQLDVFRKQQEEAERKALEEETNGPAKTEDAQWIASGRKRKRGNEAFLLKGVKLKKTVSGAGDRPEANNSVETDGLAQASASTCTPPSTANDKTSSAATKTTAPAIVKAISPAANPLSLGLGYGSSDEDD